MKKETKNINCCANCPYFDGSARNEPSECGHSQAPRGAYENIVPRSHWKPQPIPKWCPIKNGGTLVKRDDNDKIISKTILNITGKIENK